MDALKALAALSGNVGNGISSVSSTASTTNIPWMWVLGGILTAILAAVAVHYVMVYSRTRPLGGDNFVDTSGNKAKEGFFGGVVVGEGMPECLQYSSEAAQLYAAFNGRLKDPGVDSGSDDFREFTQLLSKLVCLKKDLSSSTGVVDATRYPDYATTSDIEPVQETTARCFAKTIPQRDLDLIFDKWNKRGQEIILHLCTASNLTEDEVKKVETTFNKLWTNVYDVAKSQCLNKQITAKIAGQEQGREPRPFTSLTDESSYKGFSTGIF